MSLAIEALVSYTHNLRLVSKTRIKGELSIVVKDDKVKLVLPQAAPNIDIYRKGMTVYIAGEEVVSTLLVGISDTSYSNIENFYSSEGIIPLLTRQFVGSTSNGGYYKITEVNNNELTLDVPIDEAIEEEFNGAVCISAWRENDALLKPIVKYYASDSLGSGVISEKVKNYSYQLSDSKNRVSIMGIPKDLITPFKRFKKLPNSYELQLKEFIYG